MRHVQVEPAQETGVDSQTTVHPETQPRLALVGDERPPEPPPSPAAEPPPEDTTPRARLLQAGAQALSDAELVSLLLGSGRTGTRTGLDHAHDILAGIGGLRELGRASVAELLPLAGVTPARGATLVAALELGRRAASAGTSGQPQISSPQNVDDLLRPRMAHLDRETFVVLLLDTKNRVLASPTISVGTLSSSLVHPREVFKPAVRVSAANVILVHNHPSAATNPSREDREITKRLKAAGEIFGIQVLDHVIIGDGHFSMKEHAMM